MLPLYSFSSYPLASATSGETVYPLLPQRFFENETVKLLRAAFYEHAGN